MKIGESTNESGVKVSVHICEACRRKYTVCPPVDEPKSGRSIGLTAYCMAKECPSYDPKHDLDLTFDDDEIAEEIPPGHGGINH